MTVAIANISQIQKIVWGVVNRYGTPHDRAYTKQDWVNELTVQVLEAMDKYQPDKAHISTWAYTIARNSLLNEKKRLKNRMEHVELLQADKPVGRRDWWENLTDREQAIAKEAITLVLAGADPLEVRRQFRRIYGEKTVRRLKEIFKKI